MGLAAVAEYYIPGRAYLALVGTSLFAGLYVWIMILITHLRFRRIRRHESSAHFMPASPIMNVLALAGLLGVTLSTWFAPGLRITLMAGVPWLVFISLAYGAWHARKRA